MLFGLLVAAAPAFAVEVEVGAPAVVERAANQHWASLEDTWRRVTKAPVPKAGPIAIRAGRLPSGVAGASELGKILLRPSKTRVLGARQKTALAHELAHQFLFAACPAATNDALFHEAFAMATSGEVRRWAKSRYMSVATARKRIDGAKTLDRLWARVAVARLIVESTKPRAPIAAPLVRRLERCASGASWSSPMTATELSGEDRLSVADATVVLSRHTGEVLASRGAAAQRMPYGSTLKPFLVGGNEAPVLSVACEPGPPSSIDGTTAVLRSCNPYFIAWAETDRHAHGFGRYAALFKRLGVVPTHVTEAIGLRPTERISPFELAQAYRVLAEADRALVDRMRANTTEGTLANLGLEGLEGATKTGTVRDSTSTPRLGWIAYVGDDLVVVLARANRAPRMFAEELLDEVRKHPQRAAERVTEPGRLTGCLGDGLPVSVTSGTVEVGAFRPRTTRLCLGSPTSAGAGIVEPDGALRTVLSRRRVRAHNGRTR